MQLNLSTEDATIVRQAGEILKRQLVTDRVMLTDPTATRDYLKLQIAHLEHEVFGALFLTTRHQVIDDRVMFRGTIDGAAVYPREIAKEALHLNASAVILYHNHPSGIAEPSSADRDITRRIRDALTLFDIRVLDHLIVANTITVSFAERGYV